MFQQDYSSDLGLDHIIRRATSYHQIAHPRAHFEAVISPYRLFILEAHAGSEEGIYRLVNTYIIQGDGPYA